MKRERAVGVTDGAAFGPRDRPIARNAHWSSDVATRGCLPSAGALESPDNGVRVHERLPDRNHVFAATTGLRRQVRPLGDRDVLFQVRLGPSDFSRARPSTLPQDGEPVEPPRNATLRFREEPP